MLRILLGGRTRRTALAAIAALLLASATNARAGTITLGYSRGYTTFGTGPSSYLLASPIYVGLNTGGAGIARTYLSFDLSSLAPSLQIDSAVLSAMHSWDWVASDDRTFAFYETATDITPSTSAWLSQTGPAVATWNAATSPNGSLENWNITSAVLGAYTGDKNLSLVFRADDELLANNNQSWEYFTSDAWTLTISTSDRLNAPVVPLPAAVWAGLALLGRMGLSRRRTAIA